MLPTPYSPRERRVSGRGRAALARAARHAARPRPAVASPGRNGHRAAQAAPGLPPALRRPGPLLLRLDGRVRRHSVPGVSAKRVVPGRGASRGRRAAADSSHGVRWRGAGGRVRSPPARPDRGAGSRARLRCPAPELARGRAQALGPFRGGAVHGRPRGYPAAAARRAPAAARRPGRADRRRGVELVPHDDRVGGGARGRRPFDRGVRPACDVHGRPGHVSGLAPGAEPDAGGSASRGGPPAERARNPGGDSVRSEPPRAARHVRRGRDRDVLRHVRSAVPGLLGGVRRARHARRSSSPRPRSARSLRP